MPRRKRKTKNESSYLGVRESRRIDRAIQNHYDEELKKVQRRLFAVKNPSEAKIDDYENRLEDLYWDFMAHEVTGVGSQIELNVANFIKPLFKQVAEQLNVVIGNNSETVELYSEFLFFVSTFIKTKGRDRKKAPRIKEIEGQVREFLFWRELMPDSVIYWSGDAVASEDKAEFYKEYGLNSKNYSIETRLKEIEYAGKQLLGVNDASCDRSRIIFSVEHPDVFHTTIGVIPIVKELKQAKIDVELLRGAYRYDSGSYKGKIIEEISLLCHVENDEQKKLVLDWLEPFGQESYLLIDSSGLTTNIRISNGDRTEYGYWTKIDPIHLQSLKEGQGFSVLNGKYYQAIPKDVEDRKAA